MNFNNSSVKDKICDLREIISVMLIMCTYIYMINDFFFFFFSSYYCEKYLKNERVGGIFRIIIIFFAQFFSYVFFFSFYI